jgi:hypothetical protein
MQKGIETDLIGTMLIALAGVAILLLFVTGTLQSSVNQGFCYLAGSIGMELNWCEPPSPAREVITISPFTPEELAVELAAYSILCWEESVKPIDKDEVVCYEIRIERRPGPVSEYNLTKALEDGGGCHLLQNYIIIDENGAEIEYDGNCGDKDEISWQIYDHVIDEETFVRIIYDTKANQIAIRG